MRSYWFVALAGSFYLFVVALFWPITKPVVVKHDSPQAVDGYFRTTIDFSDASVTALVPATVALQEKGLAGRTQLSDAEGMLWRFDPPQRPAFWMKDMRIPIDIIWIRQGLVTQLSTQVPLPPADPQATIPVYEPTSPVDYVLEVAAGYAARHDVRVGDPVRIQPYASR